MLLCQVIVIILFACLSNANDPKYQPEPRVDVLNREHFQIYIEDQPGIRFVAVHVNINKQLVLQEGGDIMQELHHPVHGRWTFDILSKTHLNVTDKINYWVFVNRNHAGYYKSGTYSIRNIPGNKRGSIPHSNYATTDSPCNNRCTSQAPSTPEGTRDKNFLISQELLLNYTHILFNQQAELETLGKTNQRLTTFLEKYPDAKKLTMSGRIPPDGEAAVTVSFIIREKLELNPDIVSAVRNPDNSIEFEVATLGEKLEILEAAKEKLIYSRINFS